MLGKLVRQWHNKPLTLQIAGTYLVHIGGAAVASVIWFMSAAPTPLRISDAHTRPDIRVAERVLRLASIEAAHARVPRPRAATAIRVPISGRRGTSPSFSARSSCHHRHLPLFSGITSVQLLLCERPAA